MTGCGHYIEICKNQWWHVHEHQGAVISLVGCMVLPHKAIEAVLPPPPYPV